MSCEQCPLRLYSKKLTNVEGVGNALSGRAIIVPKVDYDAYVARCMSSSKYVKVLEEILPTGELLSNIYIIPAIGCYLTPNAIVTEASSIQCTNRLKEIIINYGIKDVMITGSLVRQFFNINIKDYLNTIILHKNVRYFVNYNPDINYIRPEMFESFKDVFKKFYYSSLRKYYDYDLKVL